MIQRTRKLMSAYERSKTMIRAGLYAEGGDLLLDQAVRVHEDLEALLAQTEAHGTENSFRCLQSVLRAADAYAHASRAPKNAAR
jgi:flagellum-specific ATP synthase